MGKKLFNNPKGISYIEAVLALPVLLTGTIFFIDMARYFLVWVVLNYAAFVSVDYASKLPIEIDITKTSCQTAQQECQNFKDHLDQITAKATEIASLVSSPSGTNGRVTLRSFDHYDTAIYAGDTWSTTWPGASDNYDAYFLRPGETVVSLEHPTRPFGVLKNTGWPQPQYNEDWVEVLSHEPIVVGLEAEYDPILPLLPQLTIKAKHFAYRQAPVLSRATPTSCGDGVCTIDEMCSCVDCSASCNTLGSPPPLCGDGLVLSPEECESDSDCLESETCLNCECIGGEASTCGDGVIDPQIGEQCETNLDCLKIGLEQCIGCKCFARKPFCGDGKLNQPSEECESNKDCAPNETCYAPPCKCVPSDGGTGGTGGSGGGPNTTHPGTGGSGGVVTEPGGCKCGTTYGTQTCPGGIVIPKGYCCGEPDNNNMCSGKCPYTCSGVGEHSELWMNSESSSEGDKGFGF